jgi:hypothetical protein
MNSQEPANLTPVKEIFDVLFTLLENMETENTAILELLDAEGIATEEKLAPYLERAGNGASVKWRAARARMEHLFSPIPAAVQNTKKETQSREQIDPAQDNKDHQAASKPAAGSGENEPIRTAPAAELSGPPVGPGAASAAASSTEGKVGGAAGDEDADNQAKREVRA